MNIKTERLTLRKFVLEDAPFLLELLNTPGFIQFIGDRGLRTVQDAEEYIAKKFFTSYENNGFGPYVILTKGEDIPVGLTSLVKRDGVEHVDIGYVVLPQYMGKGYAFEATAATLVYAQNDLGYKKIAAITNQDNVVSMKLLEKLGLVFEKKVLLPGEEKEVMLFGTPS